MFKPLKIGKYEVKYPLIQGGMGVRISAGSLAGLQRQHSLSYPWRSETPASHDSSLWISSQIFRFVEHGSQNLPPWLNGSYKRQE